MSLTSVGAAGQGSRSLRFLVMSGLVMVIAIALAACSRDDEVGEVALADIDRSPETPRSSPWESLGHRSVVSLDWTGGASRARVPGCSGGSGRAVENAKWCNYRRP